MGISNQKWLESWKSSPLKSPFSVKNWRFYWELSDFRPETTNFLLKMVIFEPKWLIFDSNDRFWLEITDSGFIYGWMSSFTCKIGLSATILLWLSVSDSKRQMVDWDRLPTPGILSFPRAWPTSACVTPSLILRCLKRSAKASSSRGSVSYSALAEGITVLLAPWIWLEPKKADWTPEINRLKSSNDSQNCHFRLKMTIFTTKFDQKWLFQTDLFSQKLLFW